MSADSSSLKEHIERCQSGSDDQNKKKKKKENPRTNPIPAGVLIVEKKPIVEEEEEESTEVGEDIQVKRIRRLEAIRLRNRGLAEDGSGWVLISDHPTANRDEEPSPLHQRWPKFDMLKFDMPLPGREPDAGDSKYIDLSLPRQCRRTLDPPSPEPKPEVEDDLSPSGRNRNQSSQADGDLSPPRKARKGSVDNLPPPHRGLRQSPEDLRRIGSSAAHPSPVRRKKEPSLAIGEDLSPPRKRKDQSLGNNDDLSLPRKRHEPSVAKKIRKENEKKRKEETSRFISMVPSMSGRGAEPVCCHKEGRRVKEEDLLKAQEEEKPKGQKILHYVVHLDSQKMQKSSRHGIAATTEAKERDNTVAATRSARA